MASHRTQHARRQPEHRDPYGYGGSYRDNLAYDYAALERQRSMERPQRRPQIRTIRRPNVSVRPAERISVMAVLGFLAAGALLGLVLLSYLQLTAISDSVVSLQKDLSTLKTENVTLTTAYERTFDLNTVESTAAAAGMSKPSASQIYYIDMSEPDSVQLYSVQSSNALDRILSALGDRLYSVVEYFA